MLVQTKKAVCAFALLLVGSVQFLCAQDVRLKLVTSGAAAQIGNILPRHVLLGTNRPPEIKKIPDDLSSPLYGVLKIGPAESPASFYFVLDDTESKPQRLFVDANANGDLTDDGAADWIAHTNKLAGGKITLTYSGGATLKVPFDNSTLPFHFVMYRFDKNDRQHPNVSRMFFYYADYAWMGAINFGGRFYKAALYDRTATGDFRTPWDSTQQTGSTLYLDLDGNGRFDPATEAFRVDKPIEISGASYQITGLTASGDGLHVSTAAPPPEPVEAVSGLQKGNKAVAFSAKAMDGATITFPETYKGKLVLLDFWATWCGPCRAEMPNLVGARQKLHEKGLEVLGVSLDQEGQADAVNEFTQSHGMEWPQIYDGKFWKAEVAQLYQIDSIPHEFLVDGDTGIILAEGNELRGPGLTATIERELAKKHGQ
jgi:thiol-disulfide isomerase/thioredoxin